MSFLYDLPKINYTKKLEKKKRIVRSPFSPGMQEHVAGRIGNVRNTCIKNIQIVYCVTKLVGHSITPFVRRGKINTFLTKKTAISSTDV